MSELVAFLRAQLDADEQAARAVEPLGETIDMGGSRLPHRFGHSRMTYAGEDGYPRRKSDPAASAHFARHDPARVLAEVAAKRRILEHRQRIDRSAADDDWSLGYSDGNYDALLALAQPYAGEPGWDDAWKVET